MSTGHRILITLPLLVVLSAGVLLVLPQGGMGPRLAAGGGGRPGHLAAWKTGPFLKGGFFGSFTRYSEDVAPVCNISASLGDILESAAFPDGTVIITSFTKPFAPMLDLFVERLLKGRTTAPLWPHIVVLNFDELGHDYCCQQHLKCYFDSQEDVAEKVDHGAKEQKWKSHGFNKLSLEGDAQSLGQKLPPVQMWRRLEVIRSILTAGYHVLFTDLDIVWLQDPRKVLKASDADIQFTSDFHNPDNAIESKINTGFYYARSTPPTIAFFDYWFQDHETRFPKLNEQEAIEHVRPDTDNYTASLGLKLQHLPMHLFASFCAIPRRLEQILTIHSNCCLSLNTKLRVLRKSLEDYDWLMSAPGNFRKQLAGHDYTWIKGRC